MIHVLIVEDDPMARKLFEIILQESDRYIVTAAIESASLAEFYCMTSTVDLILMDVCTALRSSGLEAAAKIKKIYPKKKIIIVTSQPECDFVERARKSGVESFWYKDPSAEHLLDVMDRTMRGESVYPDKVPQVKVGMVTSHEFTEREMEVLRLMTTGASNAAIAEKLVISESTVKNHIHRMLEKTGCESRTELAIEARISGIAIKI